MTDPEATHPPRKPNTLRAWLPRIGAWLWAHPGVALPLAVMGGVLIGAVMF